MLIFLPLIMWAQLPCWDSECVHFTIDEDNQYAALVVEQLRVENVFRYIAANYNDRIINIERFKDIYTNHLQYE